MFIAGRVVMLRTPEWVLCRYRYHGSRVDLSLSNVSRTHLALPPDACCRITNSCLQTYHLSGMARICATSETSLHDKDDKRTWLTPSGWAVVPSDLLALSHVGEHERAHRLVQRVGLVSSPIRSQQEVSSSVRTRS